MSGGAGGRGDRFDEGPVPEGAPQQKDTSSTQQVPATCTCCQALQMCPPGSPPGPEDTSDPSLPVSWPALATHLLGTGQHHVAQGKGIQLPWLLSPSGGRATSQIRRAVSSEGVTIVSKTSGQEGTSLEDRCPDGGPVCTDPAAGRAVTGKQVTPGTLRDSKCPLFSGAPHETQT